MSDWRAWHLRATALRLPRGSAGAPLWGKHDRTPAAAVRHILAENGTTGSAAALLNALRYTGRKGGQWNHQRVQRTLTNPKTLIFCTDDNHAEEVVMTVREVFGEGNDFAARRAQAT